MVSGDLTQRARRRQFQAARAFLDRFPAPVLVVPGNHDIPLFDLARRFFRPLGRYRSLVTADLAPLFHDDEVAVLGVNTARSNVWKSGRLSLDQIDGIRARLSPLPPRVFKVLVTHHPFVPPPGTRAHRVVGRGLQALQVAEACGVDLLLAGHLHVGWSGDVRAHHLTIRRSILVVQAGTATSLRVRFPSGHEYRNSEAAPAFTLTFKNERAKRRTVLYGHVGLLEAYFDGDIDIDGSLPKALAVGMQAGMDQPTLLVRIRNRWHEFMHTNASRRRIIFHDVYIGLPRRFIDASHWIAVEIRLLDDAILGCDLAASHNAGPKNRGAFKL